MIGHWLNRQLQVWRRTAVDDGYGGQTSTRVRQPDDVRAKVDQPSASERLLAAQTNSHHTHSIYLMPDADVRRGDELHDESTGQQWRVLAVVAPSTARYRKADAELIQGEGEPDG